MALFNHTVLFLLAISLVSLVFSTSMCEEISISSKNFYTFGNTFTYGTYDITFESPCNLTLGYILNDANSDGLFIPPYYAPQLMCVSKAKSFSNQIVLTSQEKHTIILFNNETNACSASVSFTRPTINLSKAELFTIVPYGETVELSTTFRASGPKALNVFYVKSESDFPLPISYSANTNDTQGSITLPPRGDISIGIGSGSCSVKCEYPGNCPLYAKFIFYITANPSSVSSMNMNFASIGMILTCLIALLLNL